ncbi:glycoside hydrolase TIM-barrel-like domain-containing protein [Tropicibacter sp. R16_0]|uniref:baseplate multidomain protein megatron n=1 Tax=Tropicibacter sp. R16_0 TaxID=2821102 RepID=UPI001ADB51CF|nr:glycoside hydrolase TIM-barrel-like domain-containing protein [Tropicibacter sp. R16_0]MBO9453079.1 glycoside hydrolase TIM-barrel-like domain-containing protein [Tropicibacter sp. R16_0]
MATILLSAAGAALGGSVGGTVAGIATGVVGRAVGATVGRVIDQRLLGSGGAAVETGRVDRFRLTQTGEGASVARVFGRVRAGGQVIWASDFKETSTTTGGGGKGSRPQPKTTTFSYSVSLAVAICEGEIASIGRVWADGEEVAIDDLNMRVYPGSMDQLPDPVIEAVEGEGQVPAYRGTAYVVLEDLPLDQFGNRVPQFSFEVVRQEQPDDPAFADGVAQAVQGVAIIPGTGEYALATSQVNYSDGPGSTWAANVNSPSGKSDFVTSMDALSDELPECQAASLVVSWFGGDLRCGSCELEPKVGKKTIEGINMPWTVAGLARGNAKEVARVEDRPVYGATPADASVVEAIRHLNEDGKKVMFYPFILMDQVEGNGLPDPWSTADNQAKLPWRGRITLSKAPGQDGSPDKTADADAQVAAFVGTASAADFTVGDGVVTYTGPDEWTFSRFILHYAALCAAAGGVASFCIGSELRGLTQIRGASGFPMVAALKNLATQARILLGSETKIGYAADWSEYFGYQPVYEPGSRYFNLDPLWADENIDFIGIDNYMPLSDWRDDEDHRDAQAGWKSIYDEGYLAANIEGGEGFDWYYHSPEARAAQIRTKIEDQAHDEPWIWRYKDLRGWWSNTHHERIDGVRQAQATDWVPQSKPIWFTELGCAAVDKGTNQPNKFLDPKSSESSLPHFSNGFRDDLIQHQYLRVMLKYWSDAANNPSSSEYDGSMIDMSNAFVWSWDARPYPAFPNNAKLWSDGENYSRGHWLNGRSGSRTLASVVSEICRRSGLTAFDVSELHGIVIGYTLDAVGDARSALQPLMLKYGFDAIDRDGKLQFVPRGLRNPVKIADDDFAVSGDLSAAVEHSRDAEAEMSGRVRLRFVQAGADHDVVSEEAVLADDATHSVSTSEFPLAMSRADGRQTVERWLAEARVSRDKVRFALPLSKLDLGAGDVVELDGTQVVEPGLYRIDRVEQAESQLIDAVRTESKLYEPFEMADDQPNLREFVPPLPVLPYFLDLPLLSGDEEPHAPHLAVTADPWPGTAAVYSSGSDADYVLDEVVAARAVVGTTQTVLRKAAPGLWDQGDGLQVKLISGDLESKTLEAVLGGANLCAIGDGSSDNWELFQFQTAELVGPKTYILKDRLRGQAGTDALMPDAWPEGSVFVLLDGRVDQIPLKSAQRRIARHYRIGPARRGYDDPSYLHRIEAFDGNGLRPYSPAHLRAVKASSGDIGVSWIRRTRIEGDDWSGLDVPLGEESESYLVRVMEGSTVLRETTVGSPEWTYTAAQQALDASGAPLAVEVAQVSSRYGAGPITRVDLPA